MVGNHGNTFPSNIFDLKKHKKTQFVQNLKRNTQLLSLYEIDHISCQYTPKNCLEPHIIWLPTVTIIHYLLPKFVKIEKKNIFSMVTMATSISLTPNTLIMKYKTGKENMR